MGPKMGADMGDKALGGGVRLGRYTPSGPICPQPRDQSPGKAQKKRGNPRADIPQRARPRLGEGAGTAWADTP